MKKMNRYILKLRYWLIDKLDPKENKCDEKDFIVIEHLRYFISRLKQGDCIDWNIQQNISLPERRSEYIVKIILPEKGVISL